MTTHLKPLVFAFQAAVDQTQSPLFSALPAELRARIFDLCLIDCENVAKKYDENSLWNRPGHYAPHISHTEILRTCKQCYQEAWFMAWANKEQNIYLVAPNRRPNDATNPFALEAQLQSLADSHGEVGIKHVHLFSQLYLFEDIRPLQDVLNIAHFFPKRMTITIRHTDFWYWEDDARLKIRHSWVQQCRFPDSLVELALDFETLQRKKDQVDYLASEVAESWVFTRKDGRRLISSRERISTHTWSGRSTLNDARWIRDEAPPGRLDYTISTITFRLEDRMNTEIADLKQRQSENVDLQVPDTMAQPIRCARPYLDVHELHDAHVSDDTSAEEALRLVEAYENQEVPDLSIHGNNFGLFGIFPPRGGFVAPTRADPVDDEQGEHDDEDQDEDDDIQHETSSDDDGETETPANYANDNDYSVSPVAAPALPDIDFLRFGGYSTRYASQWYDKLKGMRQ